MNRTTVSLLFAAAALLSIPLRGQAHAADPYRDEPFVFERSETTITMKADGTGDTVQHVLVRVQSEGVARQFSVLNLSYASANSTGTMDFVRVHKPDGTTVNTPVDDAMEMPAEVSREAPMYSDVKEKHLPVRSLAAGDRLEYQFHTNTTKALAPGQFWGADHFIVQGGVILNEILTLQVPEKTYVQVWSPNHPVTPVTRDGMKIWTWKSSQTKASARDENGKMTAADVKDPDEDSDGRKLPSVAWTTFHSWAEVGDWYRSLAEQRLQPTATVRAKADDLTKNAITPQAQAEALYRFVATQIRYISISFGVGRFQPHTPDEVLDHGYGDCKDKDTLLESLLRAKGLTTAPVLIGAGIAPVPDVPSPAVFNHAITTVELPGADGKTQRIWLDSTAEVAPFRVLMPVIRDQQALVIPDKAPAALQKTPADPPYGYLVLSDFEGTLNKDGLLKGRQEIRFRSDAELVWRSVMQRSSPSQWDEVLGYMAPSMGYTGKVSNTDLRQTGESNDPFRVKFDYTQENFYDWKRGNIIGLFPWLDLATVDKDKEPKYDIDMGAPRTLRGHSVITLPPGYRAELPSAIHVAADFARFDETWRIEDGRLLVDREVTILKSKLAKSRWKDYLAFCADTTDKGEPFVSVVALVATANAPAIVASGPHEKFSEETATLAEMQAEIKSRRERNDWAGARELAERQKGRFPNERYVLSVLAYIDNHDKKYDEAVAGYKAELAAHPDDAASIIVLLGSVYYSQKRYAEGIALLESYASRKDPSIQNALINMLSASGEIAKAVEKEKEVVADRPTDKAAQTNLARLLQKANRNDEAAAAAKTALESNNDANLLNSNAYFLAEMKTELPLAESSSRRSVEMFDRMNSTGTVEEANTRAFMLSSQMVAAWDTLGYILLVENKAKSAEPYLSAAWFDMTDMEKGEHLAEAYESMGRKEEARWVDTLSMQSDHAKDAKDFYAKMQEREQRLQKDGVKLPQGKPQTLQEMRTFHMKRPDGLTGSSTIRVQLSGPGIIDATIVSGDTALKPMLAQVQHLNIPASVPPASPARVLRDAVLYCGKTSDTCDFVFMTNSGIGREGVTE